MLKRKSKKKMYHRFYCCNKEVEKSHKSWFSGYNLLWGHIEGKNACEFLYVPREDYENFLSFVLTHPLPFSQTYEMDVRPIKSLFGTYYILSNFNIYKGRFCSRS
jgi:hypothetical protein